MTAFYVLARPMILGKHEAWRCVGRHDDYAAADAHSFCWGLRPGWEVQIVAAGALSNAMIDRYDVELAARAAWAQAPA